MRPKKAWQSLLVSAALWAGILAAVHFWPRHMPWGASAAPTPTVATRMTYLPGASEEMTKMLAAQPAFGALIGRMRVNLVDFVISPNAAGLGSEIDLKNRTDDELRWLEANPNSDEESFIFPKGVDAEVDSMGMSHCHDPNGAGAAPCDKPSVLRFVSRGRFNFDYPALNDVMRESFCMATAFGKPDATCMKGTLTYRLTIDNGAMRIYSAGPTYQAALAQGLYWMLENAVIGMSITWRTRLSPTFYLMTPCDLAPSCEGSGMTTNKISDGPGALVWPVDLGFTAGEVDPDHLSMEYVMSTPEFANWGGDQFERCLQSTYDPLAQHDPGIPVARIQTISIETTGCLDRFPTYLLDHPNWFHEHPVWAIRFKVGGDQVPTGPITQADIDRYTGKPKWQILREKKPSP